MIKLHFNTPEEFESIFKSKSEKVTTGIVSAIEEAVLENKRTAMLFEITFEEHDNLYEISLPKSQWVSALEKCLEHYAQMEMVNEQIDTWKLLEAVKTFQ